MNDSYTQRIMKNGTLPFFFDKQAGSRIGLLPRQAIDESDIKWFSFPSQMIFHTANAWQVSADLNTAVFTLYAS
jgi:carotenoid cleavage dioxygenase-like enzyme